MNATKVQRLSLAVIGLLAWLAVVMFVMSGGLSLLMIKRVTYFTVLANVLVAIVATASSRRPNSNSFLTRPNTASAAVVYIAAVGIYSHAFHMPWEPVGITLVEEITMHDVVPILYVCYWLVFVTHGTLKWIEPLYWLLFPLVYVAWVVLYSSFAGNYPYYFPNLDRLGYTAGIAILAMLLAAFFVLGLIAVAIDHLIGRVRARRTSSARS
jgi:uncharacterized membrane protein